MLAARPSFSLTPSGAHIPKILPPPAMAWPRLAFFWRSATQESRNKGSGRAESGSGSGSGRWMTCLRAQSITKGKGLEVEAVEGGGVDMWDAAASAEQSRFPEHLVVMVNGLIGSAEDWKFAAEQFVKKLPDKVIVHCSECNYAKLTFDGVDKMGERLAEEVISVVNCRQGVKKISFIAHSLGGLVARYAVGRLYEPVPSRESPHSTGNQCDVDHELLGKIAGLMPMNFITSATPHLGSRGNKQLPFLCGLSFLERRASEAAHFIVGRTGKHLFLTDDDDGRPPLLLRMVDDCDDIKFRSALRSFKRRVAYANSNFDHMVGWRTSSIRRQHELPKHRRLVKDEKYPHIVCVDKENTENNLKEAPANVEAKKYDLEEEMIRGLTQVPWERVDVSFQKSRQRLIAHTTIQVKSYWLNSDGEDVVYHMIDNFLV